MSDLQQYVGSCLCGAVTYQIDGPIGDIIQCHCQKCRKANGTAYATNAPIAKADFKLTSGQDVVKKICIECRHRALFLWQLWFTSCQY